MKNYNKQMKIGNHIFIPITYLSCHIGFVIRCNRAADLQSASLANSSDCKSESSITLDCKSSVTGIECDLLLPCHIVIENVTGGERYSVLLNTSGRLSLSAPVFISYRHSLFADSNAAFICSIAAVQSSPVTSVAPSTLPVPTPVPGLPLQ